MLTAAVRLWFFYSCDFVTEA